MANIQLNLGSAGSYVATDTITRDTVTEHLEIITLGYTPDGTTLSKATIDSNGLHVNVNGALPAGTNNIGSVNIANAPSVSVSNDVTVSEDGCTYLNINDASSHTVSASLLVGFQELSGTAQAVNIKAFDGPNVSSTVMTPPITLGAGQIITLPRGGIKATSGQITFECSAAPGTPGVQALYHA